MQVKCLPLQKRNAPTKVLDLGTDKTDLSRVICKQVKAQHNFCLYQANQAFASVNYSIFSAHTVAMKVPVSNFFLFDALISCSPINHGYALIYHCLWQEVREVSNSWFIVSVVQFCREGGRLESH